MLTKSTYGYHFTVDVNQTTLLYTLNSYSDMYFSIKLGTKVIYINSGEMEKQKTTKIVEHDTSGMTAGKSEEMKQEIFPP